ncbi:MAG: cobalamin biosynthesis protein [Bilophila wadsworthia]
MRASSIPTPSAASTPLCSPENRSLSAARTVFDRHFAGTDQVIYTDSPEAVTARHAVLWDAEGTVPEEVQHLDITGKSFVLGVGCRRGVEPLELRLIAEGHLSDLGLRPEHIAAIASCDVKADEPAILELGEKWQVPVEFHAAARLDAVPVPTPSAKVREKVGTASVSEAACLLSAGYGSIPPQPTLYAPKAAFGDVTLALARLPHLSAPKARSRTGRGCGARLRRSRTDHARGGRHAQALRHGGRIQQLR